MLQSIAYLFGSFKVLKGEFQPSSRAFRRGFPAECTNMSFIIRKKSGDAPAGFGVYGLQPHPDIRQDIDANIVLYTPSALSDWDDSTDPGDLDDALDQLAARVKTLETGGGSIDASDISFTPLTSADWDGDSDPGDVDDALNQLAERVKDLEETGASGDAAGISYTPNNSSDWDDESDPGNVDDALDQLASRVMTLETDVPSHSHDASDIPYAPDDDTDWDEEFPPEYVNEALDQLAARLKSVEENGGGGSGGVSYTRWNPLVPPENPSGLDDEFDDENFNNAKWDIWNYTEETLYTDEVATGLRLEIEPAPGGQWTGIYQELPSGPFTAVTLVHFYKYEFLSYGDIGISLHESANSESGDSIHFFLRLHDPNSKVMAEYFLNYEEFDSTLFDFDHSFSTLYLRLRRYDESNEIHYDWSHDGISWVHAFVGEPPFSPQHIGLSIRSIDEADFFIGGFRFFRYKNYADGLFEPVHGQLLTGGEGGGGGGGGGGPAVYFAWDVDAPPEVPSSYDDEFNDGSFNSGKWSNFNHTSATMNTYESDTGLRISFPLSPNNQWAGIYQNAPSEPFVAVTKIQGFSPGIIVMAGIALFEDATDSEAAMLVGYLFSHPDIEEFKVESFSDYETFDQEYDSRSVYHNSMYVRLRCYEGFVVFEISTDGIGWAKVTVVENFSYQHIGLVVRSEWDEPDIEVGWQFFRIDDTTSGSLYDPVYGRLLGRGSS